MLPARSCWTNVAVTTLSWEAPPKATVSEPQTTAVAAKPGLRDRRQHARLRQTDPVTELRVHGAYSFG